MNNVSAPTKTLNKKLLFAKNKKVSVLLFLPHLMRKGHPVPIKLSNNQDRRRFT